MSIFALRGRHLAATISLVLLAVSLVSAVVALNMTPARGAVVAMLLMYPTSVLTLRWAQGGRKPEPRVVR